MLLWNEKFDKILFMSKLHKLYYASSYRKYFNSQYNSLIYRLL